MMYFILGFLAFPILCFIGWSGFFMLQSMLEKPFDDSIYPGIDV